jgi:hypothetical protein
LYEDLENFKKAQGVRVVSFPDKAFPGLPAAQYCDAGSSFRKYALKASRELPCLFFRNLHARNAGLFAVESCRDNGGIKLIYR